ETLSAHAYVRLTHFFTHKGLPQLFPLSEHCELNGVGVDLRNSPVMSLPNCTPLNDVGYARTCVGFCMSRLGGGSQGSVEVGVFLNNPSKSSGARGTGRFP
ncbi:FERM domain containing protein 4A, partial [Dissostichus eleginoides]